MAPLSPTTKELINVAHMLSFDWKMLVHEIDIPDSEINAIVERYKALGAEVPVPVPLDEYQGRASDLQAGA